MTSAWRRKFSAAVLAGVSLVSLTGFGCRRSTLPSNQTGGEIVVWGLWQDSAAMEPVIKAFTDKYGVKVTYKKMASVSTYEQDLLKALAEGRGPDVFVMHHTWVDDKLRLLSPAPASAVDEKAVKDEFVDVVDKDMVRNGQVYGLPTSVDAMAMYYNKDLLNAAGIPQPPRTWTEFQSTVARLTRVNQLGTIEQSGAALGAAANINRASDILGLLMLQSGLPIYDAQQKKVSITGDTGKRALTFYTDFANKAKKVYSWNLQQDYSIDAFAEGKTAIMLNYSYQLPVIRAKNPRLNFGVAPMPQIDGNADNQRVDFAAYWPFGVASSSRLPDAAWTFVRFITNKDSSTQINAAQAAPPARRDAVLEAERDPDLGVFAQAALTAQSWRRVNINASDAIINAMIDSVVNGSATIDDATRQAEGQLNNLDTGNASE